jgi:hypothetical protein
MSGSSKVSSSLKSVSSPHLFPAVTFLTQANRDDPPHLATLAVRLTTPRQCNFIPHALYDDFVTVQG